MSDDLFAKIHRAQILAAEEVVIKHLAEIEAKFLAKQKARKKLKRSKKP